ncbi:UDP-N-acetylmuramate dehydrogenase [Candidatus Parcubacteria bacterium]|nr:MAG: UDP-N-acetylmuramate dehydrogenase [Candidatus Parcubacteria bacterium]
MHMSDLHIKEHEPLAKHTVFRIGGPARFYADVDSRDQWIAAFSFAEDHGVPWMVLGAGSNVLVSDAGFPGLVIHPVGGGVRHENGVVEADAGVSMARVVADTLVHGLRGFEWAIGVPGTIGGSVVGNAGCFGSEMKDVVVSILAYDTEARAARDVPAAACAFGYRDSMFKRAPQLVVLAARLALQPGDAARGQELVRAYTFKRHAGQDIGAQTAGCAFKNIPWTRRDIDKDAVLRQFPDVGRSGTVPGIAAGLLIDRAGLKGYQIGGAKISERHGNFIINVGNARAEDVVMLIALAKERVHRMFGIFLEEEIRYIGFEDSATEREPLAKRG